MIQKIKVTSGTLLARSEGEGIMDDLGRCFLRYVSSS